MKRRDFLHILGGAAAAAALPDFSPAAQGTAETPRPNILWISCEDISPDLGCYGDSYAVTPNLDRLASQGVRYTNVFTHAGVCAPVRSGIITAMYPTTVGTHNMRCKGVPPDYVRCFTEYLRAAGYYCTNNVKTDYQFAPPLTAWDENSRRAHWRNRPEGRPFFSVFNITVTHESKIRSHDKKLLAQLAKLRPDERHDPAKAVLPPYYPDTPVVRKDWARYYDLITLLDKQVAAFLEQLEKDGLADDTIVWFWSDHGRGLPRAKRWIYDSGTHIPLIIRVPEKYRKLARPDNPDAVAPGSVNDDLIGVIDFGPTLLSLAGVKVPSYMQGRPFLGPQRAAPRRYVFGARDRMDEAYDLIRCVRDKRFKYIRNYMPYVTYGQNIDYMNQMPTMKEMRRLNAEGKLVGPQKMYFLKTKPIEELYDIHNDPHEVNNLAGDPNYKVVLERLRKVHLEWMKETGDVGFIPEPEFDEMIRPGGKWQKTAPPTFKVAGKGKGGAVRVELACATPGASIAYKIAEEGGKLGNSKVGWELYVRPVEVKPGQILRARAYRLGFRDSAEARFEPTKGAILAPPQPKVAYPPDWRKKLDESGLLERLRAIKALDGKGEAAIPAYTAALRDPAGSVRYWGVVGLHVASRGKRQIEQAEKAVSPMLGDPSPIVRIAAAEALCDWGEEERALPVLVEALHHRSGSVRLNAAIALGRIGEKARPALAELKKAMKDPNRYVTRVVKYVLRDLEGGSKRA